MTNREKNILAGLCRTCSSFHEVLVEAADRDICCSKATVKKYWRIFHKENNND